MAPANNDGILIPKIDDFAISPTNNLILTFRVYVNGSLREQGIVQSGASINSSFTEDYNYNFNSSLSANDQVSFRIIPTWGITTPSPRIFYNGGSTQPSISIIKCIDFCKSLS